MDPWHFVDADDDLVADFLAATIESVIDLGGLIHPDARFIARDGQVSVRLETADASGEHAAAPTLIRLPAAAFIRITRVNWTDSAECLEMDGLREELTEAEIELLILQMALHNACGKIPWLVESHPMLADLPDDVVTAAQAIDPSFRAKAFTPAEVLWSNRVLRLPTLHNAIPEPVALPLVDLLNHHACGAVGTWTGDEFVITASTPIDTECAMDYGYDRDAITMALTYGFLDESNERSNATAEQLDTLLDAVARAPQTPAAALISAAARYQRHSI